jgi:hypothetical protein
MRKSKIIIVKKVKAKGQKYNLARFLFGEFMR